MNALHVPVPGARPPARPEIAGMLAFHRLIVEELLEEDGLTVMAAGLGIHKVLAALIRLHNTKSRGVMLILGYRPEQLPLLHAELLRQDPAAALPSEVGDEVNTSERRVALYRSGGVLLATSRILTVDLLTSRCRPADVAGFVVLNAHRVHASGGDAFALRLWRGGGGTGYVRALSDSAAQCTGFNRAARLLGCLRVRRLNLWPRFRDEVADSLSASPPAIMEHVLTLPPVLAAMQESLASVMDALLDVLRRCGRLEGTGLCDLSLEAALGPGFDAELKAVLDPGWNTLTGPTKQAASDLRTLQALAGALTQYSATDFCALLTTRRHSAPKGALWPISPPATALFDAAQRRVYTYRPGAAGAPAAVTPVLEEMPKWGAVRRALADTASRAVPGSPPPVVVIAARDGHAVAELESMLRWGSDAHCRRQWRRFYAASPQLQHKVTGGSGAGAGGETIVGPGPGRGRGRTRGGGRGGRAFGGRSLGLISTVLARGKAGRGAGTSGGRKRHAAATLPGITTGDTAADQAAVAAVAWPHAGSHKAARVDTAASRGGPCPGGVPGTMGDVSHTAGDVDDDECDNDPSSIYPGLTVHLVSLDCPGAAAELLASVRPHVVIAADVDGALVRELEVHAAESALDTQPSPRGDEGLPPPPPPQLAVALLRYDASLAEATFRAGVLREQRAFAELIHGKAHLVLPVDDPTPSAAAAVATRAATTPLGVLAPIVGGNALTRHAGGQSTPRVAPSVVVDMREFGAALPGVLHAKGATLHPVTLEVGDYVLSPTVVVERKSLADLISSLASGRLYAQAEAMVKHYATAVLLIEFSPDADFGLASPGDLGEEISPTTVGARLTLLILHFPRLRVLWARSPQAAADLLLALKAHDVEPSASTAAAVGVPVGVEASDAPLNETAAAFLRKLPGVTAANARAIMAEAGSLAGVAAMPLERLSSVMGSQQQAAQLREFLDAPSAGGVGTTLRRVV